MWEQASRRSAQYGCLIAPISESLKWETVDQLAVFHILLPQKKSQPLLFYELALPYVCFLRRHHDAGDHPLRNTRLSRERSSGC